MIRVHSLLTPLNDNDLDETDPNSAASSQLWLQNDVGAHQCTRHPHTEQVTVLLFTGSGGSLLTVWDLGYLLSWKIIFFYLLSGWILVYLLMNCEIGKGSTPNYLSFFAYYRTTCAGIHAACGFSGSFDAHPSAKPSKRRRYSVPAPNSLWHIDGNHKLIRGGKMLKLHATWWQTEDLTGIRTLLAGVSIIKE